MALREMNLNEEPSAGERPIHIVLSLIASSPAPFAHVAYLPNGSHIHPQIAGLLQPDYMITYICFKASRMTHGDVHLESVTIA